MNSQNPVHRQKKISPEHQTILECVDAGLDILGKSAKASTIYFIELKGGLKFSEIPDKPDQFIQSLRGLFGVGSRELFIAILKELRQEERLGNERAFGQFVNAVERGLYSVESGIA